MNDLQKLISLRGMTLKEAAKRIGHGYHFTQKVIKGTKKPLKNGGTWTYRNRAVECAVAELLGLSHSEAWGPKSSLVLQRLIKAEIKKQARVNEQKLHDKWLPGNTIAEKQATGNV